MKYGYQAEKLAAARRCLMLPHTHGIEQSIADAFMECQLAFHRFDETGLDGNARGWIAVIKGYMDTSGIVAEDGEGTWFAKARLLSADDQLLLRNAIDELAHWFEGKFWQDE